MTIKSLIQALKQSRLAWLVLLVSLMLTGVAWYSASVWEEDKFRQEFEAHARDSLDAVSQRLAVYVNTLYGMRGLFSHADQVTRDEFRRYVAQAGLGGHHPGVHTYAFVRYVPAQQKERFEMRVREETRAGKADYAIFPPSARDDFYPIEYVEPEATYHYLLGLDRGTDADTLDTLERARDNDQPAASGRLHSTVELIEGARFFLLMLPIYRNGAYPVSVMERRAALVGFVTARVELAALLEGVVGAGAREGLFFEIYDGGGVARKTPQITRENLLYAADDGKAPLVSVAGAVAQHFPIQTEISVAGRNWLFFFGNQGGVEKTYLPIAVLLGGMTISALLFALVLTLIAQRRRVADEIVRQKSLFSQVLDALPVNVFLKDRDFRFVLVNEETARTAGLKREAIVGKTNFDVFPHEVAASLLEYDEYVFAVERLVMREEYLVGDGQEKILLAGKKIIRLPGGSEPLLLGFSFDISDRKKAERELERQQRFIRQVIDNIPSIIFVKDADGTVLLINQAGAAYFGLTPEQFVGRHQTEIFPRHKDISGFDSLIADERQDIDLEEPLTLENGHVVWLSMVKRSLPQPDGKVHVLGIATDITARKHAENLERQFGRLLQSSFNEIYLFDAGSLRFLESSEGARKTLGYSADELNRMTPLDIKPSFTRASFEQLLAPLRSGEQASLLFETFHRRKDGTTYPVEVRLQYMDVHPPVFLAIILDISERLRLEEETARARANELSRSLTDAVGVGLVGLDAAHRVIFANPKAQEALGVAEAVMQGRKLDDVVQAMMEDGTSLTDGTCPAWLEITAGRTFQADDWLFLRGDGSRFPVSLVIAPMIDRDKVSGAVLSFQDITRRKEAEIALRETERRQAAILDNIPELAWLKDSESRYIAVNEPCAKACGMSAAEVVGKNDFDFFPVKMAELYRNDDREVMTNRRRKQVEEPLMMQDGKSIWVETTKTPIINEQGIVVGTVGTARDITARRAAEAALNHHMVEIARVNDELDEFTHVASHDLQEPARKLVAFSDLLRKDLGGDLPPRAAQDMVFIVDAAQRMQRLVQDLLALSRTGHVSMVREQVALDDAVDRALEALEMRIAESAAAINRVPLPTVSGDLTLLSQLYQNLIGNALKFVDNQSPEISLTAEQIEGAWVFGVRDNGIGIDPQYRDQIFHPFKRLHGRGQYEGSGIGLSICRKVVERHNGRIWVESEEGKGAHFRFTLGKRGG